MKRKLDDLFWVVAVSLALIGAMILSGPILIPYTVGKWVIDKFRGMA